jgi:hypothetical protein
MLLKNGAFSPICLTRFHTADCQMRHPANMELQRPTYVQQKGTQSPGAGCEKQRLTTGPPQLQLYLVVITFFRLHTFYMFA